VSGEVDGSIGSSRCRADAAGPVASPFIDFVKLTPVSDEAMIGALAVLLVCQLIGEVLTRAPGLPVSRPRW
jgi:hypothetical protein